MTTLYLRRVLCRLSGHRPKSSGQRSWWSHRHWRMRYTDYFACARCGCGEPECWNGGLLGKIKREWYEFKFRLTPRPAKPIKRDDDVPF
jgi:hypothetical protein